jgi:hypothetical protein
MGAERFGNTNVTRCCELGSNVVEPRVSPPLGVGDGAGEMTPTHGGPRHPSSGRRRRTRTTEVGRTGARFGSAGIVDSGESDGEAEAAEPGDRESVPTVADTDVGLTGARFGPYSERWTGRDDSTDNGPATTPIYLELDEPPAPAVTNTDIGKTGARFGPYSERWRHTEPEYDEPAYEDIVHVEPGPPPPPEEPLATESDVLIRPYARTGGRTRPTRDLAIEALITTSPRGAAIPSHPLSRERRAIADMCVHPRSVAEVAALLAIPLGVARILLSDMVADGMVVVHGGITQGIPDLFLMERVLAGLRRL